MTILLETYKQVFNLLQDFAFLINESADIVDINFKVKQRDFSAVNLGACFVEESKDQFNRALRDTPVTFRTDFFFSSKDHFFTEVSVTPLTSDQKIMYLVVVKDITVQHDKELDLLRFSEVIHRTVNPTQITNPEGKIIYVNPAYVKISGYTREELIGKNPSILNSGKHGKDFWKRVWSKILTGQQWVGQVQNKRKNGELFYTELVISPIIDEQKKVIGFLGAHRDITEQKNLERQVVRSQKMETFGTLAAGIAHEVGNPLTSISSLVQLVQRQSTDDFVQEKLELAKNQINRISKILRELVDFSRPSTHDVKDVSVNLIIREALNIVQYGKKSRSTAFDVALEENLAMVYAVPDQLLQVYLNILMNAVDACEGKQGHILVSSASRGDCVEAVFKDNGSGISEKNLAKLFDPFFTTKEVGKGTGLGLWVSLGIVRNFGGDIFVESEEGKSTTFIVRLPVKGA
jgi:PAS domain S-box-containing protein